MALDELKEMVAKSAVQILGAYAHDKGAGLSVWGNDAGDGVVIVALGDEAQQLLALAKELKEKHLAKEQAEKNKVLEN